MKLRKMKDETVGAEKKNAEEKKKGVDIPVQVLSVLLEVVSTVEALADMEEGLVLVVLPGISNSSKIQEKREFYVDR